VELDCETILYPAGGNSANQTFQDEEGHHKLPQNEVNTIKQELIGLMIAAPSSIQAQLGETISVIAESDFWENWQTLVDVSSFALVKNGSN
jgi:exportin-2 (importin alpha re-exporter)